MTPFSLIKFLAAHHFIKVFIVLFLLLFCNGFGGLKVLHLTFHNGCKMEIESLSKELGFELETMFIPDIPKERFDGITVTSDRYNIDEHKASEIWNRNKDYFFQFDLIITSDTAPLSRIFLQNNFSNPLIIWVCNRFDYVDAGSLTSNFPDPEYYDLIRNSKNFKNVKIISYTAFEHVYAKIYRNVNVWNELIKPIGFVDSSSYQSIIPSNVDKSSTFYVPCYHNDTIFMNLSNTLTDLGISNYCGRYNGPLDLKGFKGIIHIPYAWSNLALFENMAIGQIYFIPSARFLCELSRTGNFFWSPPFSERYLSYSEWYCPENKDIFVFFDSWADLVQKINSTEYLKSKELIIEKYKQHKKTMLEKWRSLINTLSDQN